MDPAGAGAWQPSAPSPQGRELMASLPHSLQNRELLIACSLQSPVLGTGWGEKTGSRRGGLHLTISQMGQSRPRGVEQLPQVTRLGILIESGLAPEPVSLLLPCEHLKASRLQVVILSLIRDVGRLCDHSEPPFPPLRSAPSHSECHCPTPL